MPAKLGWGIGTQPLYWAQLIGKTKRTASDRLRESDTDEGPGYEAIAMIYGDGEYRFEIQENWWTLPTGWSFGWIPAVAVD
ncbi:MAG: hypothetical protein O3B73_07480, partial [bacterium]|nr:hypothetical protein [bacterium]